MEYGRNYTNKDYTHLCNTYITEYDMQSAGLNVLYYYNHITKKQYEYFLSLDKKIRNIKLGLLQRKIPKLAELLSEGMVSIVEKFIQDNNLLKEDILSIKNDAIFVINKVCNITKYKNIEFRIKNKYTSFYRFDNKEFYYCRKRGKDIIDVKGINDNKLELHKEYMLDFLSQAFRACEIKSHKEVFLLLKDFAFNYKEGKLDIGYYRELNSYSFYRTTLPLENKLIGLEYVDEEDFNLININYNYRVYILGLMNMYF